MRLSAAIEDPDVARRTLECLDLPARAPLLGVVTGQSDEPRSPNDDGLFDQSAGCPQLTNMPRRREGTRAPPAFELMMELTLDLFERLPQHTETPVASERRQATPDPAVAGELAGTRRRPHRRRAERPPASRLLLGGAPDR